MSRDHRGVRTVAFVLLGAVALMVVLAACTGGPASRPVPTPPAPEPTPVPQPVSLPADEAAHDDALEWWYYNGHLEAENGQAYGFHFVIFQSIHDGDVTYAAQFAVADPATDRHVQNARFGVGGQPPGQGLLDLELGDWSLAISDGEHSFNARGDDGTSLDLSLSPTTPAMLHNGIGWMGGEFGWTYYYSWPRMDVVGTLSLGDGETLSVGGEAWFDHQWGDFFVVGHPAGWQWFALQLDDGSSIMITEARGLDGAVAELYGTFMNPSGQSRHLGRDDDGIILETLDTWVSPETGGEYPSGWRLRVQSIDLDLEMQSVIKDQEVTEGVIAPAIYWEGKVAIEGAHAGEAVGGRGYVELTGYAPPPPVEWRTDDGVQ
ncbi:MAG: lipocalin family protein [Dehalococcoidia bacterium]